MTAETSGPVIQRRPPLTDTQIDQLLAILTRNGEAYDTLVDTLHPSAFALRSKAHALVWRLVRRHCNQYQELPEVGHLRTAVGATLAEDPDAVQDEELDILNELVEYIYDDSEHGRQIEKSKQAVRVATDTAKQLLTEHSTTALIEELRKNGQIPTELPTMLAQGAQRQAEIDAIGETAVDDAFPDGWEKREKVKLFSCGVPILDEFMGGGWRAEECVLFMGPFGSCKTTLCVMGVANTLRLADQLYRKARETDPEARRPVVFLMFTEGSLDDYRMRLLSNLARIPWKRLNQMENVLKNTSRATRPAQYRGLEYEREIYRDMKGDAGAFINERGRIEAAVALCRKHLVLLDCTGNTDDPRKNVGAGGVGQLANVVRAHMTANPDVDPMAFYLDHASALASRMVDAVDASDDKAMRRFLKQIPRLLVDKLAKPFKAPVLVFHQLSGEANSRGTTGKVHHTDGAECKSIAEFVAFAIVTGPPDGANLCKFECTKHRREPPSPWRVARIRGDFNEVVDVSADYGIDPGQRVIRHKDEMKAHSGKKVTREVTSGATLSNNADM